MRGDRSEDAASARARWLAELADALLQAQDLAWRLGQAVGSNPASMDLYGRIEALRGEVRSLQLRPGGTSMDENDPKWTSKSPWCPPSPEEGNHKP